MRILATAAVAFAAGVFSTQILPEGGWLPLGLAALAAEKQADLVLLAGDLLDGSTVYQETAAALAAALGALCAYGVQLLVPVLVLLVVMVLDYITGMAKAWHAGELSSRVGLWGILKKVGYLVIVGVACVVDWLLRYGADSLGWSWPVDFLFASIVIIWLVINELLSILENVSAIGAPVPGFMQALLKKLKVHTEDTAEENLPGEENSDE